MHFSVALLPFLRGLSQPLSCGPAWLLCDSCLDSGVHSLSALPWGKPRPLRCSDTHTPTHPHTHTHMHTQIHTHTHRLMHTHTYARTHARSHTHHIHTMTPRHKFTLSL